MAMPAATLAVLTIVLMMYSCCSGGALLGVEKYGSCCSELPNRTASGRESKASEALTGVPATYLETEGAESLDSPDRPASLQHSCSRHSASGDDAVSGADRAATQACRSKNAAASIAEAVSLGLATASAAAAPSGTRLSPAPVTSPPSARNPAGPVAATASHILPKASAGVTSADAAADADPSHPGTGTTATADMGALLADTAPASDTAIGELAAVASVDAGSYVAVAGHGSMAAVAEVPGRARARLLARLVRLMPLGEAWSAVIAPRSA
jgi:hypothetical protein